MYQITFMKKSQYHVIKEAVEYAKKKKGIYEGNFVNAILRRYTDEVLKTLKDNEQIASVDAPYLYVLKNENMPVIKSISIGYSFPEWIIARWLKKYGEKETVRLCSHLNKPPSFTVRIEATGKDKEDIIAHFEKNGITFKKAQFIDSAYYTNKLAQIIDDPLFKDGLLVIQDEASQLAGIAVSPEKGDVILDACCGLGTKTVQLKTLSSDAVVYSMDKDFRKLKRNKNTEGLICGDVLTNPFKKEIFHKVLLDAPCSSVGIIRKHPEIKWRLKEKDIKRYGRYQLSMIESIWPSLKKNSYLIYSVCSFEPEETILLIEELQKKHKFIIEKPLPFLFNNEYFLSLPHKTDLDGFFIARLKKQ